MLSSTAAGQEVLTESPPASSRWRPAVRPFSAKARASEPCSFARRLQDIESDTGYDTRRRELEGTLAGVSQTAVCDTCGSATAVALVGRPRRMPPPISPSWTPRGSR